MAITTLADVIDLERTPWQARGLPASTFALLQASAQKFGDKLAFRYLEKASLDEPTRDVSYRELFRSVVQAANLFAELGVNPDVSVSMLLPLSPEAFVAMIGAQTAGMANPINFLLEPHQIASLLREARCRVLLAPDPDLAPGLWPKVEAALRELPEPPVVLRVGGPRERAGIGAKHFKTELDRQPGDALTFSRDFAPDEIASLFHTGGTTALPKLARHTHRGLALQSWINAEMQDLREDDVWLMGLPIFHVGGANCAGLTALSLGATCVLLTSAGYRNPAVIANLWAFAERFRASVIGMVPTSWGAALNAPTEGFDLSNLRVCVSGAATLPHEIAREAERRLGRPICEGWGMTETHGFGAMTPALGEVKTGAIGVRAPYTELIVAAIVDERVERRLAPGEIGRVLVRGPMLFAGYENEAHNAWIAEDGGPRWFDTGDLGRFDEDGYVWLTGRAKDVIIRGGHNIDPSTIEEVLHQHPAVQAAAAVGRPDAHAGEIPIAFVQLKPGASATTEDLQAFARERVGERAAAPAEVRILAQMPLTGVGKIFKPALRQIAAQDALTHALAAMPERVEGLTVEVAAHPKHGQLATVRASAPLGPEAEAAVRRVLGRFQIKTELAL